MQTVAQIDHDMEGVVEDITTNNISNTSVTAYMPDLTIQKTAMGHGRDGILGTEDDNDSIVQAGEKITYKITYQNIGDYEAAQARIIDRLPQGNCLILDSLQTNPELPISLQYSDDDGGSRTYTPSGSSGDIDCTINALQI